MYSHGYAVCCRPFPSPSETLFLQNVLNAGSAFQASDAAALISDSLDRPADIDNKAVELLLGRYSHISFSHIYRRYTNDLIIYNTCF